MYSSMSEASYAPQAGARPGINVPYHRAQPHQRQGESGVCNVLPRKAKLPRAKHEHMSQRSRCPIAHRGEKVADHEREVGHAH